MSDFPKGRLTRDKAAYRENPSDGKTDRRVADLEAIEKLNEMIILLGGSGNGEIKSEYGEINSLTSSTKGTITSITANINKKSFLQLVEVGGENIATYTVEISGVVHAKRRTYFSGGLSTRFDFDKDGVRGFPIDPGDVVEVKVIHERPTVADFEARIQVYEE